MVKVTWAALTGLMAAPVTLGNTFDSGSGVALFQANPRQTVLSFDLFVYGVSRNGERFLINTPTKQTENRPLSVVLNWAAGLKN